MRFRFLTITCVLMCLGAILPVSIDAKPRIISPAAARLEEQEDDNEKWEKEAKTRESEIVRIADDYYKQKDYRKAADYYKQVVDLRYEQWDFPRIRDSVRPAHETTSVKLSTSNTRRARDRLDNIGDQIDAEETKSTQTELNALFGQADVEKRLGNVVEAYTIYAKVVELAVRVGKEKYAVDAAIKAEAEQANILKETVKPLVEVRKLIAAGKIDAAEKSLDEFTVANRAIILLSPDLAAQIQQLKQAPAFMSVERKQKSEVRLQMGESAFMRGNYVIARRHYREIQEKYPETEAARVAEAKLTLMLSDPVIQAALAKQDADSKCAPLMARAQTLAKYERLVEAGLIAEKIIADYPGTKWATMANALIESIKSAKSADSTDSAEPADSTEPADSAKSDAVTEPADSAKSADTTDADDADDAAEPAKE